MVNKTDYRCRACGQTFNSLGDMQRHIVTVHLQEQDFARQINEAA